MINDFKNMTNLKSKCCSKEVVWDEPKGKYFCAGLGGCGRYCELADSKLSAGEKINYMQIGQTVKCGNCFPDEFEDCKSIEEKFGCKCCCKCHSSPSTKKNSFDIYKKAKANDTSDGQTVKEVLNIAKEKGNAPSNEESKWELEFEKLIKRNGVKIDGTIDNHYDCKKFIRTVLTQARQDERKRVRELTRGEEYSDDALEDGKDPSDKWFKVGYNKALEDFRRLIN
jgi:hypothetical protein